MNKALLILVALGVAAWTPPKEALDYPLLLNQGSNQVDSRISVGELAGACVTITGGSVTFRYLGNQEFSLRCERNNDGELFAFQPSVSGDRPAFLLSGIASFSPKSNRAERFDASQTNAFMASVVKQILMKRPPNATTPREISGLDSASPTSKTRFPIVIGGDANIDACPGQGVVFGLDPRGDGFLAVKASPDLHSLRVDKLFNGHQVNVCATRGDWLGVVYSKSRQDCNVSTPWPIASPYTGPCQSGWVHKNYVKLLAG